MGFYLNKKKTIKENSILFYFSGVAPWGYKCCGVIGYNLHPHYVSKIFFKGETALLITE